MQTHRCSFTGSVYKRPSWWQRSAEMSLWGQRMEKQWSRPPGRTVQGSGAKAVRGQGELLAPQEPGIWSGQEVSRVQWQRTLSFSAVVRLEAVGAGRAVRQGLPVLRPHATLAHPVAALGPHSKTIYHPRTFLQVGSWVTARATEFCFRSQAYLWRQGWAGARQSWTLRIQGKGGQSHSWGKILPMDSLSPGRHQEAVSRG